MLWTAFTIGLLGSIHCVGMCGPLAMTVAGQSPSKVQLSFRLLQYNLGRTLTYMLLGMIVGGLGWGVHLAGWQSGISIVLGIALLILALNKFNIEYHLLKLPFMGRFNWWLRRQLGKVIGTNEQTRALRLGLLNGLLPCGLVYVAIIGALTTDSVWDGALYMLSFGLGTIPLMFASVFVSAVSLRRVRFSLQSILPFFLFFLGGLLLLRGLQFDLPPGFDFLDPLTDPILCH